MPIAVPVLDSLRSQRRLSALTDRRSAVVVSFICTLWKIMTSVQIRKACRRHDFAVLKTLQLATLLRECCSISISVFICVPNSSYSYTTKSVLYSVEKKRLLLSWVERVMSVYSEFFFLPTVTIHTVKVRQRCSGSRAQSSWKPVSATPWFIRPFHTRWTILRHYTTVECEKNNCAMKKMLINWYTKLPFRHNKYKSA